ncbi:hypothetical protein K8R03_02205 [Candidatus Kaiserbacteria bacterium]|nr:hypothetical protein [Candidatus Kaiserbacteria bacterium]
MNMFKTFSMKWWQVGIFKLSLLSAGVAIGAYWPQVFAPYISALVIIAVIAGLYTWYTWSKE